MTQRNNILEELNELKSRLAEIAPVNCYAVPEGYFDGLADQVLNKIKALEATNPSEELEYLSPLLNGLSRQMPFSIPAGYFEKLESIPLSTVHQTAAEELQNISPLLSGLNKEMPYQVPENYFEDIAARTGSPVKAQAKVISISSRKWVRYAAAAMVTGVIALSAFLVFGKKDLEAMPIVKFEKKLNKEIQKMSDTELDDFIQYTDAALNGEEKVSVNGNDELHELLKDVPESELKEFLEETSDLDTESSIMN